MNTYILRNAIVVNELEVNECDLLIRNGIIERIGGAIDVQGVPEIDVKGNYILPGIIDDQVHFREPGLTYKGDIYYESRASVAGGVTSYMEMPNTKPPAITLEALEEKYAIGAQRSIANYSFYLGATNDNLDELLKGDYSKICGIKVFMGSSTGNMLVDQDQALTEIFRNAPALVATHCEDEATIEKNLKWYKSQYGDHLKAKHHPLIRSAEGCFISSSKAVDLAKKYNTRLHILHISTEIETALFSNEFTLEEKRITAEACVHHMYFADHDYEMLGNKIKCNPAIKTASDREAIINAVKARKIDVVATDHAPHTAEEKDQPYLNAPSGMPLIQYSFLMMMDLVKEGIFTLPEVVDLMCHRPAICFKIMKRGFIREGYAADLFQLDDSVNTVIHPEDILYKCGWSPLEGRKLPGRIIRTWVNGNLAYFNGRIIEYGAGHRLAFDFI